MSGNGQQVLLSARGLSFQAGRHSILQDFEVDLSAGEIVGLIGPNGAGKTTAVDLLSGFRSTSAGSVRLAGRELTGSSPDRRARLGLARTFQESPVIPGLSVRDHVLLALDACRRARQAGLSVAEVLGRVGLAADAAREVVTLPIGKRRLLDVGRAWATAPTVLLLDEPFAGLEQHQERLLEELLERLRREGVAVLIVEHRLSLLGGVADSVLVLVQGRLIAHGPMDSVLRDSTVQRAYLHSQGFGEAS